MTHKKRITAVVIMAVLLVLLCGGVYAFGILNASTGKNLDASLLGANGALSEDVTNIAFFGIDGRADPEVEGDRTDVIMIATLNKKDNSVKITSIMRDTFVQIQSTSSSQSNTPDYEKINAAYMNGGAADAIATINTNFDMNITDYVTVDFNCLMDIVDAVGGITVNVQNEDVLHWTNEYLKESNGWGNRNDPDLTTLGEQTLTGAQALAYARNRYSDSDYGRTMRQREVVEGIFNKAKNMNLLDALGLVSKIYPYVQTSMSLDEITSAAKIVMSSADLKFENNRLPLDMYSKGGYIDGSWFLFPDTLAENATALHTFIYGADDGYTPSETVQSISNTIETVYLNNATEVTAGGDATIVDTTQPGVSASTTDSAASATPVTDAPAE